MNEIERLLASFEDDTVDVDRETSELSAQDQLAMLGVDPAIAFVGLPGCCSVDMIKGPGFFEAVDAAQATRPDYNVFVYLGMQPGEPYRIEESAIMEDIAWHWTTPPDTHNASADVSAAVVRYSKTSESRERWYIVRTENDPEAMDIKDAGDDDMLPFRFADTAFLAKYREFGCGDVIVVKDNVAYSTFAFTVAGAIGMPLDLAADTIATRRVDLDTDV
jgi:hypothetical protein